MNLKRYEPKLIIYYKDINWVNTLLTSVHNKQALKEALEKRKFVEIEGILIKTDLIQLIKEYKPDNSLWAWISIQSPEVREVILNRDKEKKEKVGKWFETIEEVKRYLRKKWIKNFIN